MYWYSYTPPRDIHIESTFNGHNILKVTLI